MPEKGSTRKEPEIELQIENLGPIKHGNIKVAPITVFIGKNNTGKSYTAQMLYAILKGRSSLGLEHFPERQLKALMKGHPQFMDVKGRVVDLLGKVIEKNCEDRTKEKVKEIFGPLRSIVRMGSRSLLVNFRSSEMNATISERKTDVSLTAFGLSKLGDQLKDFYRPSREPFDFLELLFAYQKAFPTPYFLPAERAGFTRLVKTLLRAFYSSTAFTPRYLSGVRIDRRRLAALGLAERGEKVPALTLDLFNTFLTSRPTDNFRAELKSLEDAMEGTIIEEPRTFGIMYQHSRGPRVELQAASSGVAELAPLYLMVQKTLSKKSLLIFEEPEAHLHPRAQVLLARFIARLARGGVRIILTTHSTLLPIALVHLVGVSSLPIEKRKEIGYDKTEYLTPEELALYHFRWCGDGSIIERMHFDSSGRTPELPEMDQVVEALFGEEARLIELSTLATHDSSLA
jgi:predicted ATPase